MVCAPCAEKARRRREALYQQIKEQGKIEEAPTTEDKPSNYKEATSNSIYKRFKEKLNNSQALINK